MVVPWSGWEQRSDGLRYAGDAGGVDKRRYKSTQYTAGPRRVHLDLEKDSARIVEGSPARYLGRLKLLRRDSRCKWEKSNSWF